ncbi:DUF4407 domain-containing protein [Sphaerisporangium sp. NPDC051011]|uniref:DUF4407 domain-containing protein n=1 Tax=Sphaerisporangium sp. NPDC051011 TaxID=3155792 RepID=UPI0033DDB132
MRKLLIVLSGARPDILERWPTDRGKFEGIGGAVLTTSVLATISMTFALSSALGLSIFVAVPAGIVWGLAILSLDRWLVSSIQPDGPRRWRMAVPRILMAVLLGVVTSTPLVLQIFKSEIDAQIVEIKQDRANSFTGEQNSGTVGQQIARLRKAVADQEAIVTSGGEGTQAPDVDPKIKSLTAERAKAIDERERQYDEWQCQLYGGPDCPRKGDGVLAKASEKAYKKAKNRVDALNAQIEGRKRELAANDANAKSERLASAKAALPALRSQLDAALRQQAGLQASFDAENQSLNGLLIRLRALNEVSGKDMTLNGARLLLFLMFLLIECLPVAVKLMQKPGNYEKVLALVARNELLDARDSLNAGPRLGSGGTSATVREIWNRPSATEPDAPAAGPPRGPEPFVPPRARDAEAEPSEQVSTSHDFGDLEDEALRGMPDTRTAALPGGRSERTRGYELFPDED